MTTKHNVVSTEDNVVPDEVFAGYLVPSYLGVYELPTGTVRVCDCGALIYPTGQAGRPAKTCEACRAEIEAHRAKIRVRKCLTCKRFLAKPKHRGRPAHHCPSCKLKMAEERQEINEEKFDVALARGYCDSRCMSAQEEECKCYCEGHFHQADFEGLGPVPDRDQ